ncbi:hypothetical protein NHQ30_009602 [Ciborinia camelliae]|nr:hypothetical protein NHQ30_009602 [Ciborinia camelliae]
MTGVSILPETLTIFSFAKIIGILAAKTCRLDIGTPVVSWGFLVLGSGVGMGLLCAAMNLVIQASIPAEYAATAARLLTLFRAFGQTVGVAIQSTLTVPAAQFEYTLETEAASAEALISLINALPTDTLEVVDFKIVSAKYIKTIWVVICEFAVAGMIANCLVKGYDANQALVTDQGIAIGAEKVDLERIVMGQQSPMVIPLLGQQQGGEEMVNEEDRLEHAISARSDKPCGYCIGMGLEHECTYDAPYSRGLAPKIRTNPARDQTTIYDLNFGFNSVNSSQRQLLPSLGANGEVLTNTQTMSFSHQQQLNSSSNATFLQRFPVLVSAFGDLPMPTHRTTSMVALPNNDVGSKLVETYFEKVSPSMLFFHIPTVEHWAVDLLSDDGYTLQKQDLKSRNAAVLLIFASAQAYLTGSETTELDTSMRYFQLADEQLKSETGRPNLISIQARLLQCFYLLARGRINQCWSTFGTVVTLIYTLGIHHQDSHQGIINLIDIECRKRVFWAAFALDKYLSYALDGRPQLIALNNTNQDLPKSVEDRHLTSTFLMTSGKTTISMNLASILQTELVIIISKISKEIYGIRGLDVNRHLILAKTYMRTDLSAWKKKAGLLIDADPKTLNEIYNRQRTELLIAYYHAKILLLRNFLLYIEVFEDSEPDTDRENEEKENPTPRQKLAEEVDEINGILVDACMSIYKIITSHSEYGDFVGSLPFRSAWFAQYVIYSAAVVTYITSYDHPEESTIPLKWARLLHQPLKSVAQPGTFIGQCVGVLDELKDAVDFIIKPHQTADPNNRDAQIANQDSEDSGGSEYEDTEDVEDDEATAISISSDDGSETLNGNEAGGSDSNMDMQRNDGGGPIPVRKDAIMDRVRLRGFAGLMVR